MKLPLFVLALGVAAVSSAQSLVGPGLPSASYYGGYMFDVKNDSATALNLTGRFQAATNWANDGTYKAFYKVGTYVGSQAAAGAWTEWGTATTNGAGMGNLFWINAGSAKTLGAGETIAIALFHTGGTGIDVGNGALGYRSGTGAFTDGTLTVTTGAAKGYGGVDPFAGMTFNGRTFAGYVEYQAVPEPATLAALGLGAAALLRRRRRS